MWLTSTILRNGSAIRKALTLAERYPHDLCTGDPLRCGVGPGLRLRGCRRKSERLASSARSDLPKTLEYLLPPRVRRPKLRQGTIATGDDDQAWLYRDEMRAVWQQTPGALEWLRAHSS